MCLRVSIKILDLILYSEVIDGRPLKAELKDAAPKKQHKSGG